MRRAVRAPLAIALIAAPLLFAACGERAHIPTGESRGQLVGATTTGSVFGDDHDVDFELGIVHPADAAQQWAPHYDSVVGHQRGPEH